MGYHAFGHGAQMDDQRPLRRGLDGGHPGYFDSPEHAQSYFRVCFPWYNTEHRHSGLGLHTPETVHYDRTEELQVVRQRALDHAYAVNPERFVNGHPQAPKPPAEVWINQPQESTEIEDEGQ